MKWSVAGLLMMGLIAAVAAAVLVATLQVGDRAMDASVDPEVEVLVAARDIDTMQPITADAIRRESMPASEAPESHLRGETQAVGKILRTPAIAGQAITSHMLLGETGGPRLAASLGTGRRAVTVSLSDYAGMHELLYPGAKVDVLATFQLPRSGEGTAVSTQLLQGVQVLAVETDTLVDADEEAEEDGGTSVASSTSRRSRKVTLAVDPPQARALHLATEHGSVSLAMRHPSDTTEDKPQVTLLSEGRLADLASVLPPSVLAARNEPDPPQFANADLPDTEEPTPAPPAPARPTAEPPELPSVHPRPSTDTLFPPESEPSSRERQRWEITIFRGVEAETRRYDAPTSDSPADQRAPTASP